MANGGERLGTLCVLDRRPREMGPQEREVLRDLAGWCSNELKLVSMSQVQWELIHERDELRRKAMIDPLTQVWNRGAILEVLNRELERTRRAQGWLTLVFADIDHFKGINDGQGQGAGDELLRSVASRIRSTIRPYDAVGRYGGDEFLVVIAECQDFVAQRVADRICQRIAEKTFSTSKGPVAVTLSAGITSVHCPDPAQGGQPDQ